MIPKPLTQPPVHRTVRWQRQLELVRTGAVGWDHPRGYLADPAGRAGMAALTARYLGNALARTDGVRDWTRRHRLTEHSSCFSFWAPEASAAALQQAVAAIEPRPEPQLFRALVAAQARQASATPHPVTALFRAVDEAAWGTEQGGSLGTEQSLASIDADDVAEQVRDWCATAVAVTAGGPVPPPRRVPDHRRWRGAVVLHDRPGAQSRIAIQVRLDPQFADAASVAVLAGLLDGIDGLLQRWLRAERGLVYGTVAAARPGALVIGASLLREQLPPVVEELRRALDRIAGEPLPADLLDAAALRVQGSLYARLDEPFAALDNHRARLAGEECASEVAAAAPDAAHRLRDGYRLDSRHRPAVGYLGPLDDGLGPLLSALVESPAPAGARS